MKFRRRLLSVIVTVVMVVSCLCIGNISTTAKSKKTSLYAKNITCYADYKGMDANNGRSKDGKSHYNVIECYSGKSIKPEKIRIFHGSKELKEGKDFVVGKIKAIKGINSYNYVTVKGKGNYTGTVKVYYGIPPKTPSAVLTSIKTQNNKSVIKGNYKVYSGTKKISVQLYDNSKQKYLLSQLGNANHIEKWTSWTINLHKTNKLAANKKYTLFFSSVGKKSWLECLNAKEINFTTNSKGGWPK